MWSRHWKTANPRAERELYLRTDRLCCERGRVGVGEGHIVQDSGSREGGAKFESFPLRDTLVPALICVQVHYHEEV